MIIIALAAVAAAGIGAGLMRAVSDNTAIDPKKLKRIMEEDNLRYYPDPYYGDMTAKEHQQSAGYLARGRESLDRGL